MSQATSSTFHVEGETAFRRVLLIDDEVGYSRLVKKVLEKTGNYQIETLNDSRQAEERAREMQPDLVLIDIVMQPRDGAEVANSFRDDPELGKIPLIVMSAFLNQRVFPRSPLDFEGHCVMEKPLNLDQINRLPERIEEELNRRDEA